MPEFNHNSVLQSYLLHLSDAMYAVIVNLLGLTVTTTKNFQLFFYSQIFHLLWQVFNFCGKKEIINHHLSLLLNLLNLNKKFQIDPICSWCELFIYSCPSLLKNSFPSLSCKAEISCWLFLLYFKLSIFYKAVRGRRGGRNRESGPWTMNVGLLRGMHSPEIRTIVYITDTTGQYLVSISSSK